MTPEPPSQIALAARANEQGEVALAEHRYAEATRHFFEAASRSSEPLYFLNLCRAYEATGEHADAHLACSQASSLSPGPVFDAAVTRVRAKLGEAPAPVAPVAEPAPAPVPEPVPATPAPAPVVHERVIVYCPEEPPAPRRPKRVARPGPVDCRHLLVEPRDRACVRTYCEVNINDVRCMLE